MKDEHIINMLESAPFGKLDESELASARAHTRNCLECRRAFEAAQVSTLLLKERVAAEFEPSPFFQTRVLAALRERQTANEAWSLRRLWTSAGALVSSMAATVAVLCVLTFIAPTAQPDSRARNATASTVNLYSAEDVMLTRLSDDDMTDDQVFSTIYETDDDAAR